MRDFLAGHAFLCGRYKNIDRIFEHYDRGGFYAVRPQFAFQRYHASSNVWFHGPDARKRQDDSQRFFANSTAFRAFEEEKVYSRDRQKCGVVEKP